MLETDLKAFYHRMLTSEDAPLTMKSEVLINIEMYLLEEDRRMIQQDLECEYLSFSHQISFYNGIDCEVMFSVAAH